MVPRHVEKKVAGSSRSTGCCGHFGTTAGWEDDPRPQTRSIAPCGLPRQDLKPQHTYVVYSGNERYPLTEDIEAIGGTGARGVASGKAEVAGAVAPTVGCGLAFYPEYSRSRRWQVARSQLLVVLGCISLSVSGCAVETIVHRVDEREANRILELLEDQDISVTKGMDRHRS